MRRGARALVAEYKRRSPWSGEITDLSVQEGVRRFLKYGPHAISILVEEEWGGSYEDLAEARLVTDLPILAKGRNVDPGRAVLYGATNYLSIGVPEKYPASSVRCWTEVTTRTGLKVAQRSVPGPIVANNRDLKTGKLWRHRAEDLSTSIHDERMFVAASGYKDPLEAPLRADYVLIGEALLREIS